MLAVNERLAKAGGSAFYYGGGDGMADELAREMERRFPGLRTAGSWTPPFRPLTLAEEANIAERINASGADVVWVGIGTPKQEYWMRDFRARLDAPALIAVGAVFDFFTGRVRAAPSWVQRAYLEWLFRLLMEPRRLWRRYARTVPRFNFLTTPPTAANISRGCAAAYGGACPDGAQSRTRSCHIARTPAGYAPSARGLPTSDSQAAAAMAGPPY